MAAGRQALRGFRHREDRLALGHDVRHDRPHVGQIVVGEGRIQDDHVREVGLGLEHGSEVPGRVDPVPRHILGGQPSLDPDPVPGLAVTRIGEQGHLSVRQDHVGPDQERHLHYVQTDEVARQRPRKVQRRLEAPFLAIVVVHKQQDISHVASWTRASSKPAPGMTMPPRRGIFITERYAVGAYCGPEHSALRHSG